MPSPRYSSIGASALRLRRRPSPINCPPTLFPLGPAANIALPSDVHPPRLGLPPPPRPFHTSRTLRFPPDPPGSGENDPTHYETLELNPEASPAEIKKSFYRLSKAHHPDHHPSDPHAPRRFMRISEAYSILSHPDKRARYDNLHHPRRARKTAASYASNQAAGGRPPSGLSRRRSTFTGPPPSFFRSGGWGSHSAKRRAAHEETTGTGPNSSSQNPSSSSSADPNGAESSANTGGMGPGQDPYHGAGYRSSHHHHNHHHWFDKEAHERTHARVDAHRAARRAQRAAASGGDGVERGIFAPDASMWGGFFVVAGVLTFCVLGPYLLLGSLMASSTGPANTGTSGRKDGAGRKSGGPK